MAKNLYELYERMSWLYWLGKSQFYYKHFLGSLGYRSRIIRPLKLRNMENIFIGNKVTIHPYGWLLTMRLNSSYIPKLVIGDGSEIGHFSHITCINSLEIGRKVLIADRVYISDHIHGYEESNTAIMDQPVISKGPVKIGEGTWLGENVCILSCSIGKNCVIGANAVVNKDIPDFSVAVGAPARIIRRFDQDSKKWMKL